MSRLQDKNGHDVNEFMLELQRQDITNGKVAFIHGHTPSATTTESTLWYYGGVYSYPLTTGKLVQAKSSTGDTAVIRITGLSIDGKPQSELVTLQGTTPVNTTLVYTRFLQAYVETGSITGNITLQSPEGSPVGYFTASNNKTMLGLMTVPKGYSGYIKDLTVSVGGGKECEVALKTRKTGSVFRTLLRFAIVENAVTFPLPFLPMEELEDLEITVVATLAGTTITATCTIVLLENY